LYQGIEAFLCRNKKLLTYAMKLFFVAEWWRTVSDLKEPKEKISLM